LYQKATSGAGSEEMVLEDNIDKFPVSWSPDGKYILYFSASASQNGDMFALPLTGDRKPIPLLQSKFTRGEARISPDGRWVAYTANESGRYEVYVGAFPGPGGKWQISTTGGYMPRWRRDGSEIFYLTTSGNLMAVEVNSKGAGIEVGAVKTLFKVRTLITATGYNYDVSPDGQRFLVAALPEIAETSPVTVVLNWSAELKK
jgi:Tol biopolymer transport system component